MGKGGGKDGRYWIGFVGLLGLTKIKLRTNIKVFNLRITEL